MHLRPLHDRVVVRRIDAEEKTAGGIIIPDTAKEKPSQGEVIAVGPGAAVRRLRLGDDQAQPGPLPCRAQGHFFGYPLKRKNDPPRSNAAAMGLANRWLRFLHTQILSSGRRTMKFRPLHDRVVVKRIEAEEKTAGGIIIPDTAKEKPQQGEVVAVGPGGRDETGKLIPIDVQTGDRVLFGKWSGTEVKIDGIEYLIMKESDLMGVLVEAGASRKAA